MRILYGLVVSLLAGLLLLPANAEARSLTIDQAVALALQKSPALAKTKDQLAGLEAQRKSLRGAYFPKLSVSANVFVWDDKLEFASFDAGALAANATPECLSVLGCLAPLLSAFDFGPIRDQVTSQISVTLAQPITPLLQVHKGYQAIKAGKRAVQHGLSVNRLDITASARKSYIQVKQAEGGVKIADSAVEQVEAQLKIAKAFAQAGLLGRNDVLKVEVGLARAKGAQLRTRSGLELARTALAITLGLPASEPIEATETFADPPPPFRLSFDACLGRALKQRPALAALQAQVEANEAQTGAAKNALIPTLVALATYQHSEGMGFANPKNQFFAGGTLSWDFSWGQDWYKVEAARSKTRAARQDIKQAKDGIYLQVKKAFLDLATARQELAISRVAVKQAEEAYRIEKTKYEKSSATTTDLLNAQLALNQARLTENTALYSWYIARSELTRAMGDGAETARRK